MKRIISLLGGCLLLVIGIGCEGKQIVTGGTTGPNKITMELVGSGDQLLQRKKIDLARTFTMPDETRIDTWVIKAGTGDHAPQPLGTMIVLHGLGESKANYFTVGENLAKKGYDVVLIDLRMHGRSTGKYITCGAKEKQDVKTIVDALAKEGKITPEPLYVCGVSFGGATGIQYAAIEPKVRGVLAVAAWKDTVSKAQRDLGLLMDKKKLEAALEEAGKLGDFDPMTTSALIDIPKINGDVYLIHGLLDLSGVPMEESQALFSAAHDPKRLHIITPGPEQVTLMLIWEQWLADQADIVAKGKIKTKTTVEKAPPPAESETDKTPPPTTRPAE
ncbi:MAG: alpha/beta fold hydrolase [Phycisphaerae bacterium]|nr:alpha/beta fold hydrolase [Phycisphaerae bacterium]